jgi:predicted TIM-barrel fold metal-dependent hydrolase
MRKPKLKWLRQKKTSQEMPYETPIWLGNMSNGEFFLPQGERERKMRDLILQKCDENARRLNMDRREFIASTMGMATTLSVLNLAAGCGNKSGMMDQNTLDRLMAGASGSAYDGGMAPVAGGGGMGIGPAGAAGTRSMGGSGGAGAGGAGSGAAGASGAGASGMDAGMPSGMMPPSGSGGSDGGFVITPEMCMDQALADKVFKSDYFILDFQTHHTNEGTSGPVFDDCMDGAECTSPDTYVRKIFEMSETTVAVLSGLPAMIDASTMDLAGFAFKNEDMRNSRDRVNKAAKLNAMAAERMVCHCQISPKNNPSANAAMMTENKNMYDTRGWKCYPPTEGGWFLHENDAFIKTAIELKEPLVCAHKGFPFQGWSRTHADPGPDVGVVAMRYPDVNFVIYHSAYDSGYMETVFNPNPDPQNGGTDRLWKVVTDNNLKGKNVYAEMGSAWVVSIRDPMVAQHYIGKALKYMGEDRVVWGSECVWFGSPQNQIEAMKVFQISKEFQDMYGYPEFTDTIRRKIFGLNGASLYRVDPNACRYKVAVSDLMAHKMDLDDRFGDRRHMMTRPALRSRRDFMTFRRDMIRRGELG